ncbi:CASP-like protein 4A3 [Camellia lanceoleosa]|uniref:CASP-like protein 4A3 n=1 Tax=Camellia lanceoleosa TaxID=1840588 RepID=A0ACC0J362_9ERIC|nr:CASP-like protein 4A3 [Camellia lanceoleosa]
MEPRENSHHSNKRNRSMSDTESQTSQFDSFHSPLRSESPFRSDDPDPPPDESPAKSKSIPPGKAPEALPAPVVVFNRSVREEVAAGVTKVGGVGGGDGVYGSGLEDGVGGETRSRAAVTAILRRSSREMMVKKAELGFRVCEVILCLISFSVMASDKTQGWSGDSFDRYKEYRYCVAVTVIGFVYSGFQACDLSYHLISGKYIFFQPLRYHFDFAMDQILAYLLISASSSAATRVDDWVSNWGKDEFTQMASGSIAMSFLAFAAFPLSSLISGCNLCNHTTT